MTLHFHGLPITPNSVLLTLAGKHFCVSYARPEQVKIAHQIGQSVLLDNGAFSVWRRGHVPDWDGYRDWCSVWLDFPTTWCVIPDAIEGDEADNRRLIESWPLPKWQSAPVWHLHESLPHLMWMAQTFPRICFGSSGDYKNVGSEAWHRRVEEAFNWLTRWHSRKLPWVHMLRGMSLAGSCYPFASLDSTDIARNHNRPQNSARAMADRWDAMQCPGTWTMRAEQPTLGLVANG